MTFAGPNKSDRREEGQAYCGNSIFFRRPNERFPCIIHSLLLVSNRNQEKQRRVGAKRNANNHACIYEVLQRWKPMTTQYQTLLVGLYTLDITQWNCSLTTLKHVSTIEQAPVSPGIRSSCIRILEQTTSATRGR